METLVYQQTDKPMRVVVFFSGGASSLRGMLNDPNLGRLYRVVATFTDKKDARGVSLAQGSDVPVVHSDRREFYARRGLDPKKWDSRKFYYAEVERMLEEFHPDIICLSGYMHIVTDPLLSDFRYRILNVHPADLAIVSGPAVNRLYVGDLRVPVVRTLVSNNQLERKFKGEDTVFDAVSSGEAYTKSTVHFATEFFDEGPILVQSRRFDIDKGSLGDSMETPQSFSSKLQELMKIEGDVPAYLKALKLISTKRVKVGDEGNVFIDSEELLYKGVQL